MAACRCWLHAAFLRPGGQVRAREAQLHRRTAVAKETLCNLIKADVCQKPAFQNQPCISNLGESYETDMVTSYGND